MEKQLKKFQNEDLSTIIAELEVEKGLIEKLDQQSSALGILNTLIVNKQPSAAITFLALGLPKREAIWWAYLSVESVESEKNCLKTQQALKTVYAWVQEPTMESWMKSQALAESLELYTPTSWAAMAVFWSGDNIAPEKKPVITPGEFMTGHAVANAINLSATLVESSDEYLHQAIKQGLHIAMGGNGKLATGST